jgi:hypothetical protein
MASLLTTLSPVLRSQVRSHVFRSMTILSKDSAEDFKKQVRKRIPIQSTVIHSSNE